MKNILVLIVLFLLLSTSLLFAREVINSTVTYSNEIFEGSSPEQPVDGGVFYVDTSGNLTVYKSIFTKNITPKNGGAIYNKGEVTISSETLFTSNSAANDGGAIYNFNGGIVNIGSGVVFNSNTSCSGGAIYNFNGGIVNIGSGIAFNSNTVSGPGGAIYNDGGTVDIGSVVVFNSNTASFGGAIYNNGGTVDIGSGVVFNSNTAGSSGGAIYNLGEVTIGSEVVFSSNTAASLHGGAIYNLGEVTIGSEAVFTFNTAANDGGAIYNFNSKEITISSGVVFSSNTAKKNGGAIYNSNGGTVDIDSGAVFTFNTAINNGGVIDNFGEITIGSAVIFSSNTANDGGAIDNSGEVTIGSGAVFTYNTAINNGGAIDNYFGEVTIGSGVVFNSNIAKNGGAIYNDSGILNLITDTANIEFTKNTANTGGAIYNGSGILNLVADTANIEFTENTAIAGGAIYNDSGILNLIADTANIEFTGNTANEVSNAIHDNNGIINLYVSQNANIIFNDRITSTNNSSILNINSSTTTLTANGKVILNEDMSGYTGIVNIYGGEVELKEGYKFFNTKNFTIHDGTLIANASDILNNIENNGTVVFTGGTNENVINGTGNLEVIGDFINSGSITNQTITLTSNSVLEIPAKSSGFGFPMQNEIINNSNIIAENMNLDSVILKIREAGTLQVDNLNVINKSTLDLCNGKIEEQIFNNIDLENNLNVVVDDVDLENKKMDTIKADTVSGTGKIEINEIELLNDGKKKVTDVNFINSDSLKEKVTNNVKQAATLNYVYNVKYDKTTGELSFIRKIASSRLSLIGEYVNQISVVEQAFASMDHHIKDKRKEESRRLTLAEKVESGLWIRGYGGKEDTKIDDNQIDNTSYGALAGVDLTSDKDMLYSIYLGYNNSKQEYEDILTINHNGYVFGLSAMMIKDNWFVGVTGNIGYKDSKVDNNIQEAKDNFITYTGAIKGGYDIEFANKLVLQPNAMLMYTGINAIGYESEVETKNLNDFIVEPGLKLMLDLDKGWIPYVLVGYAFNIGNVVVENKNLNTREDKGIDNYVEYGAGVEKQFETIPLSAYFTAKGRSGGRNGYTGYVGVKWGFGNNKAEQINKQADETLKKVKEEEQANLKQEQNN